MVLVFLIVLLVGIAFVIILATARSPGGRIAAIFLPFLLYIGLLIVVFVPLAITWEFGLRALVIDHTGVFGCIRNGYDLFRRRMGRSFLVWIIGFALSRGAPIALLIAALILALPAAVLFSAGLTTAAIVAGVVAAAIFLVPYLAVAGAVATFYHAYWTLAYLRLAALEA